MNNPHIKPYTTRSGAKQFKPSASLIEEMDADNQGFCLACGTIEDGVEPDAVRYTCSDCGAAKVYGASELALMGLYFTTATATE
jgi:predicted RNA-binding Zn-ribbon protein involved in translation (DUF1610 family)